MKALKLLLVAILLGACGNATTVNAPAPTVYDDGNQGAPLCPIPSTYGGQPGAPGDPCIDAAADCSPACCECPSGQDSFWASACADGVCASDPDACNASPSGQYCN